MEEILPLTALLKHLERPERQVRCRYIGPSTNHDARIRFSGPEVIKGFLENVYFVEITTATSPLEHLRREALNLHGSVFGGPDIRAEGRRSQGTRRIVSRATARDHDAHVHEAVKWTQKRLIEKGGKTYPQPCILVVNLEPERPFHLNDWLTLAKGIRSSINKEAFRHTYITDWQAGMTIPIDAV